jgi:hypothetical protein
MNPAQTVVRTVVSTIYTPGYGHRNVTTESWPRIANGGHTAGRTRSLTARHYAETADLP